MNAFAVNDSLTTQWGATRYLAEDVGSIGQIHVSTDTPPDWLWAVEDRIMELATSPVFEMGSNAPLNYDDVVDGLRLIERVAHLGLTTPWLGRLNSGGIQLTWHQADVEVEAVFDRARDEQIVTVSVGDNEWEAPPDAAESLLATVADRLNA